MLAIKMIKCKIQLSHVSHPYQPVSLGKANQTASLLAGNHSAEIKISSYYNNKTKQ